VACSIPLQPPSDIHASLEALKEVIADVMTQGVKEVICLGEKFSHAKQWLDKVHAIGYNTVSMSTLTEVRQALPRLSESERYDLLQDLVGVVPNIVKTPGVCGGEACFIRTRIPVWTVIRARQLGVCEADILKSYPSLTAGDLIHAYHYALANPLEIDKAISENEED